MDIKEQSECDQQQQQQQQIIINNDNEEVYTTINCDDEHEQLDLDQQSSINRNTWSRTSLRRSPIHNNHNNNNNNNLNLTNRRWGSFRIASTSKRQIGSNALASELYRSSSFNSSGGRSSNLSNNDAMSTTTADDLSMYSDVSLEDDVLDLNHKVEQLQQQVNILTSTTERQQQQQLNNNNNNNILLFDDDKYIRMKTENATLQLRVVMLEEQLHDNEIHFNERLEQEHCKYKELVQRMEREKQLLYDNYQIKLQQLEMDVSNKSDELIRQKQLITAIRAERKQIQEQLYKIEQLNIEQQTKLSGCMENEKKQLTDKNNLQYYLNELQQEVAIIKNTMNNQEQQHLQQIQQSQHYIQELHTELDELKKHNQYLTDLNQELHATIQLSNHLEKGQHLLQQNTTLSILPPFIYNNNNTNTNTTDHDDNDDQQQQTCLADEFEAMSHIQMQRALKEQQDVNNELRAYIEGILLNIVENSPQLLEVKRHQQQQQQQTNLNINKSTTTTSNRDGGGSSFKSTTSSSL